MSTIPLTTLYDGVMSNEPERSSNEFGQWLDRVIEESDMTRAEVAMAADISEASLYHYLRGTRRASPRVADQFARLFGEDPNKLRRMLGHPERRGRLPEGFFSPAPRKEGLAAARIVLVPVIGVTPTRFAADADVGEFVPLPSYQLAALENPRIVIVNGDHYIGERIFDEDYLIVVDFDDEEIRSGSLLVIEHDDRLDVRKWLVVNGQSYLQSLFEDADLLPAGEQEIVGIVAKIMSVREP